MNIWNWLTNNKAIVLNVLGIIVAIIGYFEANNIFPAYITIEGAILTVLNIIINAIKGQQLTTMRTQVKRLSEKLTRP